MKVNKITRALSQLILSVLFLSCGAQVKTIPFSDKAIRYEGRVGFTTDAAVLSWSGNSVTIWFKGTGISAILQDSDTANYYNVVVDDNVMARIHTDAGKTRYVLASGLPNTNHKLQLFKRTEWAMGKTFFYGFETSSNTMILAPAPLPKRKIEFYGNSITCGYGVEDSSGNDSGKGYFENNYVSYAALTARHFGAQYSCIARSGIGVMLSWFPLIMPEMYNRLDATDSNSVWDFGRYTPDVVVVNLFQNDSWIVKLPIHKEFVHRFGNTAPDEAYIVSSYEKFVNTIRSKYPKAYIICALGNMDATKAGSTWPGYIQKAIVNINDPKIITHFFEYKNTPGHPNINEQHAMAKSLIECIDNNVKW